MKRLLLLLIFGFATLSAVLAWQLPAILRAIPSRYVARLPEPLQAIGVREHVAVLPTAATTADLTTLIRPTTAATPTPPATPTPFPTDTPAGRAAAIASPSPVPTEPPPPTPTQIPFPSSARLQGISHQFQEWNNCGPATLAMGLSYFGLYTYQGDTAAVLKPDPEDRNVSPHEMAAYVNDYTDFRALARANGDLERIRRFVGNGIPVIIETGIDPPGEYRWMEWYGHYLLVVAYDDAAETFWVYDSWLGTGKNPGDTTGEGRPISYARFDRYWRQFNRTYIPLYRPEEEALVHAIVGAHLDDTVMWQTALERTLTELEQEPENEFLWFNVGTNYNALGEYAMAATAFDQARAIGLPWRMLWYQFGPYEAYYQTGRFQDIVDLADVTLQHRPYFEESYYYRGLAYAALGDEAAAEADFQSAAAFNPNFAPAVAALEEVNSE